MRFRKEEEENFSFDMTPMIDVVFLLIIFFMVSTVFVDFSRRMDIALPSSKSSVDNDLPQTLVIEMTLQNRIFFNGSELSLDRFEKKIAALDRDKPSNVIIKADKNLPYGSVVKVMGILKAFKIKDISIAVQ